MLQRKAVKLLKVFKVGGACGGFKCQPNPEACAELLKKVMSLVVGIKKS